MAHIKCRYYQDYGEYGQCEYHEFEKTVRYYELDGYDNLNLKNEFISGDDIVYLEIDGRVIKDE